MYNIKRYAHTYTQLYIYIYIHNIKFAAHTHTHAHRYICARESFTCDTTHVRVTCLIHM